MGYNLPDFAEDPHQAFRTLLLENRRRHRTVPEIGLMALEICMPSGRRRRDDPPGALQMAYEATLNEVEADGRQKARRGAELAYHNRRHVEDCVIALACLFRLDTELTDDQRLLGLLVMAGHDLGHQGLENSELGAMSAQERLTAERLAEGAWSGLPSETLRHAISLVIGTDPALVAENHDRHLRDLTSADALLQVYINEADIAASLLPQLGPDLTRALLLERGRSDPTNAEVHAFYEDFCRGSRVTSVAGRTLFVMGNRS